jgi:hypothetical protein
MPSFTVSADGKKLYGSGDYIYTLQFASSPRLNLSLSSTNVFLSWAVPSADLRLEENLDLSTSNWVVLTNIPTLNLTNLHNEVSLTPSNSCGFYRLASP